MRGTFRMKNMRLVAAFALFLITTIIQAAPTTAPAPTPPKNLQKILFTTRAMYADPHWYANFGYWSEDENRTMWAPGGSRLSILDLQTKNVTDLINDPQGTVRDPTLHYDAKKVLFSYRKGGTKHFHLYEMDLEGKSLRQITDGPYDDIESTYLPDGDIVFCSSRAKRWVSCWFTQVAILHRADKDGKNIRCISANIEHDNTPAVLPDGRLLYTRWEYVDRSQVEFHHLWTSNPDGSNVFNIFGNMHPGLLMIDAKPIPNSKKLAVIFSPGHGRSEHRGPLYVVSAEAGPDDRDQAVAVPNAPINGHDPYPLSQEQFLLAHKNQIVLINRSGESTVLHTDTVDVHEPTPILPRAREHIIPDRTDPSQATGKLVLADVHVGRNMKSIAPGEIKKLLVLEPLPKPVNFSGGPEPISLLGTFNLERVLGTVPVESDGSAYLELPANRPFILVALDKDDLAVKRMQSFVNAQPGETQSCIGCHEQRTQTPPVRADLKALHRPASKIQPFAGIPDVIDFPRDVQPILNKHCLACHDYESHRPSPAPGNVPASPSTASRVGDGGAKGKAKEAAIYGPRAGKILLSSDHTTYHSAAWWSLIFSNQVADGKNAYGNRAPRTIGSGGSPLMQKLDGSHYGAKLSETEWRTIWMWIESGATYSGTYSALGTGMVGCSIFPRMSSKDPERSNKVTQAVEKRCFGCHATPLDGKSPANKVSLPAPHLLKPPPRASHERYVLDKDPLAYRGREILYNISRPEKSVVLLAPLAKSAGGWELCRGIKADGTYGQPIATFKDTSDPDYKLFLSVIQGASSQLNKIRRFDMDGFTPHPAYIREMKRFGILGKDVGKIDVHATDQAYWKSLWHTPKSQGGQQ